ncbi:MAG: molybdopterin-guanine dinucleotide biosynthesis protein MobB [Candidatus Lokiarchaeota archaeon]|nr:molybdopterin-guanine dinucleotide biosynthesis protein MobB [Candidatus Lokiarchaeota archaeon]
MRIIDVIGFSGSGKTYFIMKAIELFKRQLKCNVTVIKNVKHHQVDEKGKDSHIFTKSGANYSIIQNINNEMAIFLKAEEIGFEKLIKWLEQGPYKIDIVFTEGFRDLNNPTVLCVNNIEEIKTQVAKNVKIISGAICAKEKVEDIPYNIPLINIEESFERFLDIFKIY